MQSNTGYVVRRDEKFRTIFTTYFALTGAYGVLALFSGQAVAGTTLLNTNNNNNSNVDRAVVDMGDTFSCETECEMYKFANDVKENFKNQKEQKDIPGLSGREIWGPKDDEVCYRLGVPTSNYRFINKGDANDDGLAPGMTATSCAAKGNNLNVTNHMVDRMRERDGSTAFPQTFPTDSPDTQARACDMAAKFKKRCLQHANPQVELQCLAYNAFDENDPKGAWKASKALAILDTAAAATCMMGCIPNPFAAGFAASCAVLGVAEGATEIALNETIMRQSSLAQYSERYSPYIGDALGGAGALAAGGVAVEAKMTKGTGALGREGSPPPNAAGAGAADDAAKAEVKSARQGYAMACVSAGVFAALGGLRIANWVQFAQGRVDSCNAVKAFNQSAAGSLNNATGGGGGGSGSGGGGGGNFATGTSGSQVQAGIEAACHLGPEACAGALMDAARNAGAMDGKALAGGLPPDVAKHLPNVDQFSKDVKAGGAREAMGNALAGGGPMGAELADVAGNAQEHAGELAKATGISAPSSAYMAGGYGGGGGGGGNPFGGGYGSSSASSGMMGGSKSEEFRKPAGDGTDIWHSKTDLNIFQIVSEKLVKVSPKKLALK